MFYICTRSLANGALSFVSSRDSKVQAQMIANAGNYGKYSIGPQKLVYVVIPAIGEVDHHAKLA